MTYEFNPDTQSLELPNPYKVENLFLFVSGGIAAGCGLLSLINAASAISREYSLAALNVTGIAVALLATGVWLIAGAMSQLRFYFGRHRPQSLAPGLKPDSEGDSPQAVHYKEVLRHNALVFKEPNGPLNGLLYSGLSSLIGAPAVIQSLAQRQFENALGLAAILSSFLVCWLQMGNAPSSGWVGLAYAALTIYCISPMRVPSADALSERVADEPSTKLGSSGLLITLVMSVLGPVLLGRVAQALPSLGGLSVNGVVLAGMLLALTAIGTFFMALRNQLDGMPREVGAARVVDTVTMNAHPAKLMEELDRCLMRDWFHKIPNRRYTCIAPQIQGTQGQVRAEVLDETQPEPKANSTAKDWEHALNEPYFCWLVYLTGLASTFIATGAVVMLMVTYWILGGQTFGVWLALGVCLITVGMFALGVAHQLWGRFDFVSRLIWVELSGSFESAKVQLGNQLTGHVHSAKHVINVEAMTLKVWVSEIETVIFGKDAPRQLIRMRGLQERADALAANLKQFGESRSMVVAPTTTVDVERAQTIGQVNQLVAGAVPDAAKQLSQQAHKLLGVGHDGCK